MNREYTNPLVVQCPRCMFENVFNQPYAYHAGFADQGFLYNEEGNCTLIWSVFDPDFVAIVGQKNPWALSSADHKKLEDLLQLAPDGTRWLFDNPARCIKCGHAISGPITDTIYYLEYHGSVELDGPGLKKVLKKPV